MDGSSSLVLWTAFGVVSSVLAAIAIAFARPARHRDWKGSTAFLGFLSAWIAQVALAPLLVYLAWSWLLQELVGRRVAHDGSDLLRLVFGWRTRQHAEWLDWLGAVTITCGLALLVLAWKSLLEAQRGQRLATTGAHSVVRHPQYLGFVSIMVGLLLLWPSLLTVLAFAIVVVAYGRLARDEEADLAALYGQEWTRYAEHTPRFVPSMRRRRKAPVPPRGA